MFTVSKNIDVKHSKLYGFNSSVNLLQHYHKGTSALVYRDWHGFAKGANVLHYRRKVFHHHLLLLLLLLLI